MSTGFGMFLKKRSGFVLVALSLSIVFLLGIVGLAIDLGRMYVVKNESQSFCDSAAMFAAQALVDADESVNGVTAAVNKVAWVAHDATGPQKRLEFDSRQFQNITTAFSRSCDTPTNACSGSTWDDATTAAANPTEYFFVRVQTSNSVNLWFLPLIVGRNVANVAASAVAGRATESNMVQGLAPFAPFEIPAPGTAGCTEEDLIGCSRDPNDQFGMMKGQWYTLRWLAGNLKTSDLPNFCPGDACPCMMNLANTSGAATAGYAIYNNAHDAREAIVGTPPVAEPVTVGSLLSLGTGQLATEMDALETRIRQDSDKATTQYQSDYQMYPTYTSPVGTDYRGNGRRILLGVIQSAAGAAGEKVSKTNTVVGFAAFLLGPEYGPDGRPSYKNGQMSTVGACGQYMGAFTIGAPGSGGTGNTVYTLRLYQ